MKIISFILLFLVSGSVFCQITPDAPINQSTTNTDTLFHTGWKSPFDWEEFKFRPKSDKFHGHWAGVELGTTFLLDKAHQTTLTDANQFMALNQNETWTLALNLLEFNFPLNRSNLGLVTGMGIEWNSFSFQQNFTFALTDAGTVATPLADELFSNRLHTLYLNIPLIAEFQYPADTEHQLHIGVGIVGSLRASSYQKQSWREKGLLIEKDLHGELNLSSFRYGATLRLGYSYLHLFANYNFTPLFKRDKGPELYPFQVGIVLLNI